MTFDINVITNPEVVAEPAPIEVVAVAVDINNDGEISAIEAQLAQIDADLARLTRERADLYAECSRIAHEKYNAPKENPLTAYQRAQEAEFERKFAAAIAAKKGD